MSTARLVDEMVDENAPRYHEVDGMSDGLSPIGQGAPRRFSIRSDTAVVEGNLALVLFKKVIEFDDVGVL